MSEFAKKIGARNLLKAEKEWTKLDEKQLGFKEELRKDFETEKSPFVPEVATKANPVITRTNFTPPKGPSEIDTSDIEWFDKWQLQDFLDFQEIRVQSGEKLSNEDKFKLRKAGRLLENVNTVSVNDFSDLNTRDERQLDSMINDLETRSKMPWWLNAMDSARLSRAKSLRSNRLAWEQANSRAKEEQDLIIKWLEARERSINSDFNSRRSEAIEAGNRLKDSAQWALSFSGFWRSTFAAEQQQEIQRKVNWSIAVLEAERNAALELARAEAQGASWRVIESLQNYLNELETKSSELLAENVWLMNEFNKKATASYQEKVDNILKLADAYSVDLWELSEDDAQLVSSYATLAIDWKWNINESFLKQIPPRLVWHVLKEAALIKWAIPEWETEFWFSNVWDWVVAVTNPQTGEVEFKQAPMSPTQLANLEKINVDVETQRQELMKWSWFNEFNTGNVVGIWSGWVTAYGTEANPFWLDVDWSIWDPIDSPVDWKVVEVWDDKDWYGKYIVVEDLNGNKVRYAHLDSIGLWVWDQVFSGQMIATVWNTGFVIPWPEWDWSHVDITLFDEKWRMRKPQEVEQYINSQWSSFWTASDQREVRLDMIRRWNVTKSDRLDIAEKAIKWWRHQEFLDAQREWLSVDLTDVQQKQYNKEYDRFNANPIVKQFEEWLSQFEWLQFALSDRSGPWDMAWIFGFMKTLDPSSVVREGEFDSAARSAGVVNKRKNIFTRMNTWKLLTPEQAEDFKKIARVFIERKASSYDRKYDDMINVYEKFWIPTNLAPARATDQLRQFLTENTTQTKADFDFIE